MGLLNNFELLNFNLTVGNLVVIPLSVSELLWCGVVWVFSTREWKFFCGLPSGVVVLIYSEKDGHTCIRSKACFHLVFTWHS